MKYTLRSFFVFLLFVGLTFAQGPRGAPQPVPMPPPIEAPRDIPFPA